MCVLLRLPRRLCFSRPVSRRLPARTCHRPVPPGLPCTWQASGERCPPALGQRSEPCVSQGSREKQLAIDSEAEVPRFQGGGPGQLVVSVPVQTQRPGPGGAKVHIPTHL